MLTWQVPVDFEPLELKRSYRALSRVLHPDRGGSQELFARAAAAHDCLTDAECKAAFDRGSDVEGFQPNFAEVSTPCATRPVEPTVTPSCPHLRDRGPLQNP